MIQKIRKFLQGICDFSIFMIIVYGATYKFTQASEWFLWAIALSIWGISTEAHKDEINT